MIDTDRLPRRALVDSSVLIAAWANRRDEPLKPVCEAFLHAMEQHERRILIAAPTVAELLRGTPPVPLPRRKSLVPVAFDTVTAEMLGRELPAPVLQQLRDAAGKPTGQHFKYDALIVACAKRHGVDCIVSLDPHIPKLAEHVAVPCRTPDFFQLPLMAFARQQR
jgi:predicted nucleic acid-binding protein